VNNKKEEEENKKIISSLTTQLTEKDTLSKTLIKQQNQNEKEKQLAEQDKTIEK